MYILQRTASIITNKKSDNIHLGTSTNNTKQAVNIKAAHEKDMGLNLVPNKITVTNKCLNLKMTRKYPNKRVIIV